jgi:hypothetical protein
LVESRGIETIEIIELFGNHDASQAPISESHSDPGPQTTFQPPSSPPEDLYVSTPNGDLISATDLLTRIIDASPATIAALLAVLDIDKRGG